VFEKEIKTHKMDNTAKVLDAMIKAGKPLKAGEIEKLSGLSKTEVDKAMKQLKESEAIVSPQRCFWEPKKL
jgi:DNA-binding transcriptional regulator GbsR (MarR family)